MHPFFRSPRQLLLALIFWIPLCLGLAVLLKALTGITLGRALILSMPPMLFLLLLALSTWVVCRFVPALPKTLPRAVITHLLGSLIMALAALLLLRLHALLLGQIDPSFNWSFAEKRLRAALTVIGPFIYFLAIFFNYMLMAMERNRTADKRLLEAELARSHSELQALRATIHPHFLFNALTALSVLIIQEPSRAREICLNLAEFLRFTLKMTQRRIVSIAEEVQHLNNYLEIERIRLGGRLQVKLLWDDEVGRYGIPPMILQPLAENAIKHGIQQRIEGGVLEVGARRQGEFVHLRVANPLPDEPPRKGTPGEKMGLETIRKRLQDEFGSRVEMKAGQDQGIFCVEIWLPAVEDKK